MQDITRGLILCFERIVLGNRGGMYLEEIGTLRRSVEDQTQTEGRRERQTRYDIEEDGNEEEGRKIFASDR